MGTHTAAGGNIMVQHHNGLTTKQHQEAQAHARMAAASYMRGLSVPGYDLESVMIALQVVAGEDQPQAQGQKEAPTTVYEALVVSLMQGLFAGLATQLGSRFAS